MNRTDWLYSIIGGLVLGLIGSVVLLFLGTIEDYGRYGNSPTLLFLGIFILGLRFAFPTSDNLIRVSMISASLIVAVMISTTGECDHEGCFSFYSITESSALTGMTLSAGFAIGLFIRVILWMRSRFTAL